MYRFFSLLVMMAGALAAVEITPLSNLPPIQPTPSIQQRPAVSVAEPLPLQVRPLNDIIVDRLLLQAGAHLAAGALIDGWVQDVIALPKANRLARVEVRIDCTTAIVLAEADRSSKPGYLSITLKKVLVGDGATQRSYPVVGFAKTITDPFPGLPCHETDDLIVVTGRLPVILYLSEPISIPE